MARSKRKQVLKRHRHELKRKRRWEKARAGAQKQTAPAHTPESS